MAYNNANEKVGDEYEKKAECSQEMLDGDQVEATFCRLSYWIAR